MRYLFLKAMALLCFALATINLYAQQHITLNTYSGQSEIKASGSVTLTDGFYAPAGSNLRIYTGASYANCFVSTATPSADQNYILSRVFKEPNVNLTNINQTRSICAVNESIQYFDGLGRPLQTVSVNGTLPGHDLVQPFAYDAFGRESLKYQPYSVWNNHGVYRADAINGGGQAGYFTNPPSGIQNTNSPFSQTVFEPSPLNRVIEQGAPGDAWQVSGGHTVKLEYGTNQNEVKLWTVTATGAYSNSSYAPGKLYKTTTKDENWTTGDGLAGTTDEYKDFEGRILLKRVWETAVKSLSTYYLYDDLSNLRYVLPPAVNENGQATLSSFNEGDTNFNYFIYAYHYDGRKRLIEKKIPGKGWEELIYNPLDQVVFTQDAVQRQHSERAFNKYDALGRVIMTGIEIGHTGSRADVQATVNSLGAFWDTRDNGSGNLHGYNNVSAPSFLPNLQPEIVNYYDDYNIPGLPFSYASSYSSKIKGLLTATKVKVLGTAADFLWTVNYYDEEGRVVKTYSQHYLDGSVNASNYDEISNTYNFAGELTASNRLHHTTTENTTIANRYEYDHMGRKLATFEEINGKGEVVLSKLDYNEIGQLKNKSQHSTDGSSFLQSTGFGYNERGWMKNSSNSLFSLQLNYQDGSIPQFNGNISNQLWGANNSLSNTYTYWYDKLNRLTKGESTGVAMNEEISYDVMGNINTLKRDGSGHNLYQYNGNQLWYAAYVTNGYAYDANGNATTDGRTGFNFSYNHLNLPQQVSNGVNLSYTYDAAGSKLKKTSPAGTVNYIDGIQYKTDGTIDFIQTEEGLARNQGSGNYSYEYNLADHLGNNRVSFYKNPASQQLEVLQRDDYYAFGLRKNTQFGNNKYLYNGKELQEELGQYDYGARFYDPVIGRWNSVDPLAEKDRAWSPYNYTRNSPIRFIDPDGMFWGEFEKNGNGQWEKKSTKGDEIGVDFYHTDTKNKKGKDEQITFVTDRKGHWNSITNGREALSGEQRPETIGWNALYDEWNTGTGPERSVFEGNHVTTLGIKRNHLYQSVLEKFEESGLSKKSYPVDFIPIWENVRSGPNMQIQMMGSYNASFYKLGDQTLSLVQDSKSKTSFYLHLPWIKNVDRDASKSSKYNREATTYQTYIFLK